MVSWLVSASAVEFAGTLTLLPFWLPPDRVTHTHALTHVQYSLLARLRFLSQTWELMSSLRSSGMLKGKFNSAPAAGKLWMVTISPAAPILPGVILKSAYFTRNFGMCCRLLVLIGNAVWILWRCEKVCILALEKVWERTWDLVGSARVGLLCSSY